MKAPDFEGSSDPLVADEWLAQVQVILDFMGISDRDKVKCASFVLKKDVGDSKSEERCGLDVLD